MPSFCWPLGLAPKPAMTRPRTGQRNVGIAAVTSRLGLFRRRIVRRRRTMVRAVLAGRSGGHLLLSRGAGFCCWATGAGGVAAAACGARTPGMTMRSPTFTMVWGGMLLALAISASDFL